MNIDSKVARSQMPLLSELINSVEVIINILYMYSKVGYLTTNHLTTVNYFRTVLRKVLEINSVTLVTIEHIFTIDVIHSSDIASLTFALFCGSELESRPQ